MGKPNTQITLSVISYCQNSVKLRGKICYNKTNQLHLLSQIYFWNKTLHVSESSSVHPQEFFTVHTAMVYIPYVYIYTHHIYTIYIYTYHINTISIYIYIYIYHCCMYGENLLMMDRGTVRNMQSFIPTINLRNQRIQLFLL